MPNSRLDTDDIDESTLAVLRTPEARGAVLYDRVQAQYIVYQNRKTERIDRQRKTGRYYYPDSPEGNRRRLWRPRIPEALKEGVPIAISRSLENGKFDVGFGMALQAGTLDQLIDQITQAPAEKKWAEREDPAAVKALPGYSEQRYFSRDDFRPFEPSQGHEGIYWPLKLKKELIDRCLLPMGRYNQAVSLLLQLGGHERAIQIAERKPEHFTSQEIMDLCHKTQMGFEEFRRVMIERNEHDLVRQLEDKHLASLSNPRDQKRAKSPARWREYFERALDYKGPEKADEFFTRAVGALESEFTNELHEWQWNLSGDHRGEMNWQDRERLEHHRDYYFTSPCDSVKVLLDLIKRAKEPEKTQEAVKKYLYDTCDNYRVYSDKMGIALAFGDFDIAFESSWHISGSRGARSADDLRKDVRSLVFNKVLPRLDHAKGQEYVAHIARSAEYDKDYNDAFFYAERLGCSSWLFDELKKTGQLNPAADLALRIGKRGEAIQLYAKAGNYAAAREQTNSPIEKLTYGLMAFNAHYSQARGFRGISSSTALERERGDQRNKSFCAQSLIKVIGDGEETTEITPIEDPRYVEAVKTMTASLFANQDYLVAALLLHESRLPQPVLATITNQSLMTDAERAGDFAACYHLARSMGKAAEATAYKSLACSGGKKVPEQLKDLVIPDSSLF